MKNIYILSLLFFYLFKALIKDIPNFGNLFLIKLYLIFAYHCNYIFYRELVIFDLKQEKTIICHNFHKKEKINSQ